MINCSASVLSHNVRNKATTFDLHEFKLTTNTYMINKIGIVLLLLDSYRTLAIVNKILGDKFFKNNRMLNNMLMILKE